MKIDSAALPTDAPRHRRLPKALTSKRYTIVQKSTEGVHTIEALMIAYTALRGSLL